MTAFFDDIADLMTETATVWGENNTTGAHDVALVTGLRCRLAHVSLQPASSGFQRAELAAIRELYWEPSYVMPETAVLEVNGARWNVRAGTFGAFKDEAGVVQYRHCDVERGADA